jgi:predicted RND superfamily exporter protein
MRPIERFFHTVTGHTKLAIAVMVVLTVAVGAGAPQVEQTSSLDEFQTDSPEADTLDYIDRNFTVAGENTTTVQVILRGDDVLSKESLNASLRFQQALRDNETVNATLATDDPMVGIANAVAIRALVEAEATEVRRLGGQVRELNATVQRERAAIEENRTALQQRSDELNETAGALRATMTDLRENEGADVGDAFNATDEATPVNLTEQQFGTFEAAVTQLRMAGNESEAEAAYQLGSRGVLEEEFAALEERGTRLENRAEELEAKGAELEDLAARLETARADLEDARSANRSRQIETLRAMNDTEVNETIRTVLSADGEADGVFGLMPTGYEPGSTGAEATMVLITQSTEEASQVQGQASDRITDSQLTIQSIAEDRNDGVEYLVFGSGIISEEIQNSQQDSLLIVGPLALIFVLIALIVAYRDLLDIALGLLGIGSVLVWTFGFMGWADIAFNQIFIAVPVLLIGLSIDYAIHIFMRHREERVASDGSGSRKSMGVALGGVGIALLWVTATTVIGFLSNLTSPVPPIQEFGVVSAVGIAAALAVFGILVPALKIELDELLESFGFDREKRAFGTGGGRFSEVLSLGSRAARRAPVALILIAILVSSAGALGATQVDTSFEQEDFLAEDPPEWMNDLPEPFSPSEYSAKANLAYVNDRFVREDSRTRILIRGNVTASDTLIRLNETRDVAAGKNVTQTLSNGEADIGDPLSVMRSVAADNETFNASFRAADTDNDTIPDQDIAALYDTLFSVAPEDAAEVVYRTDDGRYRAIQMVVSVTGGADQGEVTTQMRNVAAELDDDDGLRATATGNAILNKVVQDELLRTVIESLIITLVTIFLFLMIIYRITEGSATLGAVTLLPVVFSLTWILGTMYLLGIPFNAVTGLITSLTIGLGVAYSIHISERYNQELERTGNVREAMRTAVTGTGGALLGSAATTVGGFGVLAFAILPPLQQFGIITGMTIVYAFLAAVLILPSLLIIWTEYAGPDWAQASLSAEGGGAAGGPAVANGEGPDEANAADDATTGKADDGADSFVDDGFVPATATRQDETRGTRSVADDRVAPGGSVEATVTVLEPPSRFVLEEYAGGWPIDIVDATPEPTDAGVRDGQLYVAWEDATSPTVTYEVGVPADAEGGSQLRIEGSLLTADGDATIPDSEVPIVADFPERVLAEGQVTAEDLASAREHVEAGALSERQFRRIYRTWLEQAPADGEMETDR